MIIKGKYMISDDGKNMIGYTKNGVAFLFDTDDFDKVKSNNWYISKRGYVTTTINRKPTPMHKVLLGVTKGFDVDHVSRDRMDNRRKNLRLCTHQENAFNQKKRITNTSGYMGVSPIKNTSLFEAYIHYNGKKHHIGCYRDKIEAAINRDKAAIRIFCEFANLNFPFDQKEMTG